MFIFVQWFLFVTLHFYMSHQMDKVTSAMSSTVSVLDPSILKGLGRGLELMSTAGTTT